MQRGVVIDDDQNIQLLVGMLGKYNDFEIVGNARTGADGVLICAETLPDIAIVDLLLPDTDGFSVVKKLKEVTPDTRVILLSALFDPFTIHLVTKHRVHGYIDKGHLVDHLDEALKKVGLGKTFFSPIYWEIAETMLTRDDAISKILTDAELVVLILVATAIDDKAISKKLNISIHTLKTHKRNLHVKLKARNDRELIAYALTWGLNQQKLKWLLPEG